MRAKAGSRTETSPKSGKHVSPRKRKRKGLQKKESRRVWEEQAQDLELKRNSVVIIEKSPGTNQLRKKKLKGGRSSFIA